MHRYRYRFLLWILTFLVAGWRFGLLPAAAQSVYAEAYTFSTFAGLASAGSADGAGSYAQFDYPYGVAVDGSGNVYVADTDNNTIRKITQTGVVTTIAGVAPDAGDSDGTGAAARFDYPQGIAVDSATNLYVADAANNIIRKITPQGVVTTLAGLAGVSGANDGTGSAARFWWPTAVAADGAGNLYVADGFNYTIRKVTPEGVVTTLAGLAQVDENGDPVGGSADGTGSAARFAYPQGIAVDSATNIYVADTENDTIRKVTPAGVVTTLAGQAGDFGAQDGPGPKARFNYPTGVAVDAAGNVYVGDTSNETIRKISPIGTNWQVTTLAGDPGFFGNQDGTKTNGLLGYPGGVAVDLQGNVYVADTANSIIRQVTPAGFVTTIAGVGASKGDASGTGSEARFWNPFAVSAAANGDIFVADTYNNSIRKITAAAVVTTLAGSPTAGDSDGVGTEAQFDSPKGLAADNAGSIYVADTSSSTVRKVTLEGEVTTIAGQPGRFGHADGIGAKALFHDPYGVAVNNTTNVFVSDAGNNTIRRLTLVPGKSTWSVTTIAGVAGHSGADDGPGMLARFNYPAGLAADLAGNLYVADAYNLTIRKLAPVSGTSNWVVSTIAGTPGVAGSADGIGGNALFGGLANNYGPYGVALGSAGSLYVADTQNGTIRKITLAGANWVVSTIAGSPGHPSFNNGAGAAALFNYPGGIAVDGVGRVYVADTGNNVIRTGVYSPYSPGQAEPIAPGANSGALRVTLLPAKAGAQWRFPWDQSWRNSGETVSNLAQGEYPIEFSGVPGYLALPLAGLGPDGSPVTNLVAVTNGGTVLVTNQYFPTISAVDALDGGTLRVQIGPSPPNGAGWRFLGETTPFYPPGYSTNLLRGNYLIEFAPVSGFVTPASVSVQVTEGSSTELNITYLLASAPPNGLLLPETVPASAISNLAAFPYGYNGQLLSDVGYGSGVAVGTNVVLTAAHLVFNDQTLSYASAAYWFAHEEAGLYEPEPLQARGWYLLSGYAEQRTNDVLGGLGPDQSSPQSRNFDAAALYFESPADDAGYGGFLSSDAAANTWLTGNADKLLVGYPVDGSQFGATNIINGQMYQIGPEPYALEQASDPAAGQEVYTASWMLSYPGNSGGPLYVKYDGSYYPAGIYLGTLFNGTVPYGSAVRAIDSNVVNLISQAAALGDSGTNNSGGGVITIIPTGVSGAHPAYLIVNLGPAAAVAAGAAWEFVNQPVSDYLSASQSVQELSSSASVQLQFLPVSGWNLPTNQALTLRAGASSITAAYTVAVTWATPAPIAYGIPLGPQQLNAAAPLTSGAFNYSPAVGAVLSPGTHTLSVTFTPGDQAEYGGPSTTNVSLVVLPAAPMFQSALAANGVFTLTWIALTNQTYQIQSTPNLAPPAWVNRGNPIAATNSTMTATVAVANTQEFYRLLLVP